MFGLFEDVVKLAVKTVALPVSAAADIVTLGGDLTDQKQSYTGKNIDGISDTLSKILED